MAGTKVMLSAAVEAYFTNLGRMRDSGGATGERPAYGPLANLLNAVGAALKPKVFCVGDTLVLGVTKAPLRPAIAAIAVPATTAGGHLAGEDFAVTTGWEHHGKGDAVMPGQSRTVERAHTGHERATTGDAFACSRRPAFRPLPQRRGVLAQYPCRCLVLPPWRLPSPQEMALVPQTSDPWPSVQA